MRSEKAGAHNSLAQSGLFESNFDQPGSHSVKSGSDIFVFARKTFAEGRQIYSAFDVVERLEHCRESLAELNVQLVYCAFHQITEQEDVRLVVQNRAVTGYDSVRIELSQILQSLRPFAGVSVESIRNWISHEVASDNDFLLGQVNNRIACGVAAAQEFDLDQTITYIKGEVVIEGQGGTLELEFLKFLLDCKALGNDALQFCFFFLGQVSRIHVY